LSVLYDQDFIDSLPAFSPEGNSHVVALLKHPENRFACARQQLEAWYLELPADWRVHYYKWLRSTDDSKFLGFTWELYVYHLLKQLCGVTVRGREVPVARGTVDYCVEFEGHHVLCEAYLLDKSQEERSAEECLEAFQQAFETSAPAGYAFHLSFMSVPESKEEAVRQGQELGTQVGYSPRKEGEEIYLFGSGGFPLATAHVTKCVPGHRSLVWLRSVSGDLQAWMERAQSRSVQKVVEKGVGCLPTEMCFVLFLGHREIAASAHTACDLFYGRERFRLDLQRGKAVPLPRCLPQSVCGGTSATRDVSTEAVCVGTGCWWGDGAVGP